MFDIKYLFSVIIGIFMALPNLPKPAHIIHEVFY